MDLVSESLVDVLGLEEPRTSQGSHSCVGLRIDLCTGRRVDVVEVVSLSSVAPGTLSSVTVKVAYRELPVFLRGHKVVGLCGTVTGDPEFIHVLPSEPGGYSYDVDVFPPHLLVKISATLP